MSVLTKNQPEYQLQSILCQWLCLQYPDAMFLSDTVASVKLTMSQAARNKKIQKPGFKKPDLMILEPRGGYVGLMLELKAKSPYLRAGSLTTDEHVQGQAETMRRLIKKGYYCAFVWTLEQAQAMIDAYMDAPDPAYIVQDGRYQPLRTLPINQPDVPPVEFHRRPTINRQGKTVNN